MKYISEQDEQAVSSTLTDFGYVKTDPGVYHLGLTTILEAIGART